MVNIASLKLYGFWSGFVVSIIGVVVVEREDRVWGECGVKWEIFPEMESELVGGGV